MDKQGQESAKDPVYAEDIIKRLTTASNKPLQSIQNVTIIGKFDLKYLVINTPVEIENSEFLDEVDLRYCEFKSVVNFSGSRFHKRFNSGDSIESHTIFRKDLICNDTIFNSDASFNTIYCEGCGYFRRARFEDKEKDIDFSYSSFTTGLDFEESVFKGGIEFFNITCKGDTSFSKTCFDNTEKTVVFSLASLGGQLNCTEARFQGEHLLIVSTVQPMRYLTR